MSLYLRVSFALAVGMMAMAQDSPKTPAAAPAATATPASALPVSHPPPQDPKIIEDGGISIEPLYWFTRAQPSMRGGKTATDYETLDYGGHSKPAYGVEIGIPAGRANTLRFSYFRVQGNTNNTLTQDSTFFSEAYSAGDYIASSYKLQSAKISWDYLSYTWPGSKIRFKTLYEVQYVTISIAQSAPYKAETTDAAGDTDTNSDNGSKNMFLPTFGAEFEQAVGKHVRWEGKISAFGLPHRSNIWDAQAILGFRVKTVELIAGGKAFHFKTSPSGDQYLQDTLSGVFVGLRYYWGTQRN
jgi:hypothetical protein